MFTVGLVGNPNCGKSTLFNMLTGATQRVGNWPGVTVEQKTGICRQIDPPVAVVDIPGVYSLVCYDAQIALDERIAGDFVARGDADVIVNVVDASKLERHLYLTLQLLEMGKPVVLALNMMDVVQQRGMTLDCETLASLLGCPVIPLQAHRGHGLNHLLRAVRHAKTSQISAKPSYLPAAVTAVLPSLPQLPGQPHYGLRLLENDMRAHELCSASQLAEVAQAQATIQEELGEEADIIIADSRYAYIHQLCQHVLTRSHTPRKTVSDYLDQIVLNRVLGIPIFLAVMYCLFCFAINVGGVFKDFFDIAGDAIFVQQLATTLTAWHAAPWLIVLLCGIGKGVATTLTFIPTLGAMFLFLSFLEASGYMARAAFVIDRAMRALGLPGKSFVPLIVGFGCNVPAIMSARTLENQRDRILTIMMTPFMSCGARLAIFAVFTSAFFPMGAQHIVFLLYLTGVCMAVVTGVILRRTLLAGDNSPLVLELPIYHWPSLLSLLRLARVRLQRFITKAGKVIIPVCLIIGVLNGITWDGYLSAPGSTDQTLLAWLGQSLTPLLAPMGIHPDNWPATVGLLTGVMAKEVVIATLNTLYSDVGHLQQLAVHSDLGATLQQAIRTIPANIAQLPQMLLHPIVASMPDASVTQGVYGLMYQRFAGNAAAMAYLLFVVLYVPCVTTVAVMRRELSNGWAIFSVCWSTALAYVVAVSFYQLATFNAHPVASILWLTSFIGLFCVTIVLLQWSTRQQWWTLQGVRDAAAAN